MPVFMVKANYEGEHYYAGPQTLRRQAYWSLLGGAAGQLYGNKCTWPFLQGWQQHLDTVGSRQFTYLTNLFVPRRWFELVPDAGHQLVVSGLGTYTEEGNVDDSDRVTAATSSDASLAIAYLPTSRGVVVDMSRLSGPIRASWYDPTRGTYLPVAGAPFPNAGTRSFAPPGPNGDGHGDWVLVLTASSKSLSRLRLDGVSSARSIAVRTCFSSLEVPTAPLTCATLRH